MDMLCLETCSCVSMTTVRVWTTSMQKCNILSHVVCTKILLIPSSGIHPDLGNLKTWQPERYAPSSAGPSRPFVKHLRSFQEGDFARRPVSLPYLSAANELYVVICGLLILICDKKERERERETLHIGCSFQWQRWKQTSGIRSSCS